MLNSTTRALEHTPTAPLPPAAVDALHRLERAFAPLPIVKAVVRCEIAVERKAAIEAKPTRNWSGAEFDSWADCDRVIAKSRATLSAAGMLHLIGVTA